MSRRGVFEPGPPRGLPTKDILRQLRAGLVVDVVGKAINLPEGELKLSQTPRPVRRCIIAQASVWASSSTPLTISVIPCSAQKPGTAGPWDLNVPDDEDEECFDKASVAYVSLVQPVLKSKIVKVYGEVSLEFLDEIRDRLGQLYDLVQVDDEAIPEDDPIAVAVAAGSTPESAPRR